MNDLVFIYKDYFRKKKRNRKKYSNIKIMIKILGVVIFCLIMVWLIHDFIYFSTLK